uniref:glutamic acid-rich protein-like n=1 Tax=Fragaria vesca subsp. vesca TaxID=101020 RepID=UPI0005C8D71E|nr:PREDICTED: glutamic acid-rich protein-like [Fragaria vesca subsp. vesca]
MKRVLTRSWKKEPDVVFEDLEWTRVKVELEDDDRKTAINAIEEVLEKVEIDVETVQKVAAFYPRCVEIDDDDMDDYNWLTAYVDFKLSPDAEEDEEEDGDAADASDEDMEAEDSDDGDDGDAADEAADIADPADEDNEFLNFLKKREKREAKDFEEAGMHELKRQSNIMGCSLKQGQEQQILSVMISFFAKQNFRIVDEYRMKMCVEDFMSRVKGYISSTCTLKDPSTVLRAVQSVKKKKKIEADADPAVHQQGL